MVQVSYPGVYIREVPSGSRTITGVATSIAVFIGRASRGPVNEAVAILSFSDYVRTFSESVLEGELTDQVRQFFLNGGQQAYVYRIAKDPDNAELESFAGQIPILARHAGLDGSALRVRVDYKTGEPGRTFNLTVYREEISAAGIGEATTEEVFGNLSLDPLSPRFVASVLNRESQLVKVADGYAPTAPTDTGTSIAGKLVTGGAAAYETALGSIMAALPSQTGRLRITVAGRTEVVAVRLGAGAEPLDTLRTAITTQFPTTSVEVLPGGTSTGLQTLVITAGAGEDISVESASDASSDLASRLGLGTANGGFEFGPYASLRPQANGLVSSLFSRASELANLLTLGEATTASWDSASLHINLLGPNYPFDLTADKVDFGTADVFARISPTSEYTLANIATNLQAIASSINAFPDNKGWKAEVHGLRLVLQPNFGTATSGANHSFDDTAPPPNFVGATGLFTSDQNSVQAAWRLSGGDDGGVPDASTYQKAFDGIESAVDLANIVVLPKSHDETAETRKSIWAVAADFCLRNRAFLVIDPDTNVKTVDQALAAVKQQRVGIVKDHSAMYWPRLQINPDGKRRSIDPAGTIAGVMARIDDTRGVWKAPAGLEADLRGVFGVDTPMSDRENGRLNPEALNCIRAFTNGIVSWGARTMDGFDNSGNDDYKYVPVRRFTLFLEESLYRGLKWAVFEPNDQRLWSQIRLVVGSFMNGLFRQGAFFGEKPQDAYFVKVDSETTTPNDINLGICNVIVGFAPLKPAEFIVVTIKQKAGQVQV